MAGRSKKLEDNSGRFRTLLQSIDTARYHDDRQIDRKVDIDQARTEILSAVLFGHEPAGVIAGCPATYRLLPEVLNGFEYARKRIHDKGRRYFPFRIGVERRFADEDPQGYDAFIRDYIAYERRRIAPHIELGSNDALASAKTQAKSPVELLAEAFLARDWPGIRAVSDHYADYFEFFYEHFVESGERTPKPVTSRDGALTTVPKDYYSRFVSRCCSNLESRGVEYEHTHELRRLTGEIRRSMLNQNVDPGQRGSWYGSREQFEEKWEDIRVWFDHALYSRMARAFGVQIPSFFTQELSNSPIQRSASLAFLDHPSLKAFAGSVAKGKPALPPAASEVNWPAVWQLVAEDDVQSKIRKLQLSIQDHLKALREQRLQLGDLSAAQKRKRIAVLHSDYRRKSFDDINEHIEFFNSGQSGFRFRHQNGRLLVDAKISPPKQNGIKVLVRNMIGAGAGAAASVVTAGAPGLIAAPAAVTGNYIGEKIGAGVGRMIDYFSRPRGKSREAQENFFEAERIRVNYWFSNI